MLRRIIFLSVLMVLLSFGIHGQSHNLPQPQMQSDGAPPPPPPGLPVDFGISGLIAAGLGLGIYHLLKKKTAMDSDG